jgi:TPP-dependent pyruvate/acetoin dehydrogenase alpha subunit
MATMFKARAAETAASKNGFSLINDEKLKQIYSTMLKCRVLEEHLLSTRLNGASGRSSFLGQEACEVGVTIDLRPQDTIVPARRAFLARLIKGEPLQSIYTKLFAGHNGTSPSNHGGEGEAQTPTASAQVKLGLEIAAASAREKKHDIVVLFGDGSGVQGYWLEALATAGSKRLPILFVMPATSARTKKQAELAETSLGSLGFPAIPVDGNDAVAVYRVAYESITRIRQGGGPTLIHCTEVNHDTPASSRNGASNNHYPHNSNDPVIFMKAYLRRKGLFHEGWSRKLLTGYRAKLQSTQPAGISQAR